MKACNLRHSCFELKDFLLRKELHSASQKKMENEKSEKQMTKTMAQICMKICITLFSLSLPPPHFRV